MTGGDKDRDILWTSAKAAEATGGRGGATWEATGVSIDTRTLRPGDLFVAIKGPRFDGHDFLAEARGAAAAVVERAPPNGAADMPLLVVDDTLAALDDLGAAARARTDGRIIAVTGSVGKTGVKEALKTVLGRQGPTSASKGSLNNKWGLPLSLARMPSDTAFGVFEMGMNHPGEIEPMSRLVRPHVAVITTVEAVHSAFFDTVEQIADAKAEVFAGMEPGGVAVLNRDNPHFDRLAAAARAQGVDTILGFGGHVDASVRLVESSPDGDGSRILANVSGEDVACRIGIAGRHWVMNGLAVLAAVAAAGGDVFRAAADLDRLTALTGRGQRHGVRIAGGRFELIDESYNASPVSMGAAIEVLGQARPGPGGRRIAVLGDMLELGAASPEAHAALAGPLEEHGIDVVFTAGTDMAHLWDALPRPMRGGHAADSQMLAPMVTAAVQPGDVIVVKGSAGTRTGLIVRSLLKLESGDDAAAPKRAANDE